MMKYLTKEQLEKIQVGDEITASWGETFTVSKICESYFNISGHRNFTIIPKNVLISYRPKPIITDLI